MDNAQKPTIRDKVSDILGVRLPKQEILWEQTIMDLDKSGQIDLRSILRIVIVLSEKLSEYEAME